MIGDSQALDPLVNREPGGEFPGSARSFSRRRAVRPGTRPRAGRGVHGRSPARLRACAGYSRDCPSRGWIPPCDRLTALFREPIVKQIMRISLLFVIFLLISLQLVFATPGRGQGADETRVILELNN